MDRYSEKKFYYRNGNIKQTIPYIDGKINGVVKKYYKNGTICSEIEYCDGVMDGYLKTYYEDGSLESQVTYQKGEKQNDLKVYNRSGFEVFPAENNTLLLDEYDEFFHHHF